MNYTDELAGKLARARALEDENAQLAREAAAMEALLHYLVAPRAAHFPACALRVCRTARAPTPGRLRQKRRAP